MEDPKYNRTMACLIIILGITIQTGFSIDNSTPSDSLFQKQKIFLDTANGYINQWLYDNDIPWEDRLYRLDTIQNYCQKVFGETSPSAAYLLHKKGALMHFNGQLGDSDAYLSAIDFYQQAIDQRLQLRDKSGYDMIKDIIRGYMNIGICYRNLNDPFNAYNYQLKGLLEADNYPEKDSIIALILELNLQLARTYRDLGDYDQALKHYNNILFSPINENHLEHERIIELKITTHLDLSGLFTLRLNLPKQGLTHIKKAKILMDSAELPNPLEDAADLYNKKGLCYKVLEKYDSAISSYKLAISINSKRQNYALLAANYNNLSIAYIAKNMTYEATESLNKAMEFYEKAGRQFEYAIVYENFSDISLLENKFAESIEYDNQSISYIIPDFKPKTLFNNPDIIDKAIPNKELLLTTLSSKAFVLKVLYKNKTIKEFLESAYQTYLLADELINLMRMDYQAEASRMSLASFTKPIYEQGIETCFQLYQLQPHDSLLDRAFEFAEKSKAIVLLDAVRKTKARAHVDPALINAEKTMNLKVNYFEMQAALYEQDSTNGPIFSGYDSLLYYRRQRQKIVDQIKEATPEYYSLIFEQETISPATIQQNLSIDQAFIEYFLGDSSLYTFTFSRDKTIFNKYENPDSIKTWANEWVIAIPSMKQDFIVPAHQLYSALIEPLENLGILPKNLTIVPDDVLNLVNFEALVTDLHSEERIYFPDFKDYMIFDHTISYAFSASTLKETKNTSHKSKTTYLGIAPTMNEGFYQQDHWFDKLDYNQEEVIQAASLFPKKNVIEKPSAKNDFLELAPSYGLIHCATHAMANNKDGDLSFIALGRDESDIIYAKDLYALDLDADLVVLSACQTSAGELNRGEGIISLARSFTYAGAASVVTSLWNVREKANKEIIYDFYNLLKEGKPKDEALRSAKLNYLNNMKRDNHMNAHPYFWATMVVIGDTSPIQTNLQWEFIIPTGLLLLIAAISYLKYQQRRTKNQTS